MVNCVKPLNMVLSTGIRLNSFLFKFKKKFFIFFYFFISLFLFSILENKIKTQKNDSYFILTTDNSPNLLQKIKRFPLLLSGRYNRKYKKVDPDLDPDTFYTEMNNDQIPIYGHINLKTCTQWEKIFKSVGYTISSLGTYESVRRGGGNQSPPVLFFYFFWSTISSLLPSFLSKHIVDTTAFIASKRHH